LKFGGLVTIYASNFRLKLRYGSANLLAGSLRTWAPPQLLGD
jgi:hypothetical protein